MRKFLVAYTASHRSGTCTGELVLDFDETATPYNLEKKINGHIAPHYVQQVISWSLIEE